MFVKTQDQYGNWIKKVSDLECEVGAHGSAFGLLSQGKCPLGKWRKNT